MCRSTAPTRTKVRRPEAAYRLLAGVALASMAPMRALACAILFLTRIPLPRMSLDARDIAESAGYFAWVGLLIAALLGLASVAALPLFGARLGALVVVALWVAVTGGLHLDGLADAIDGLSGGRGERERTLAIMRDSRIGSHGAVALLLVVLLKWAALERALPLASGWLMAPVAARYAATLLIARFPYARAAGLGSPFVGADHRRALVIGAGAPLLAAVVLGPWSLGLLLVALIGALLVALRMARLLGGLTGDVYGAAIEVAEVCALLLAPALH